MKYFVHREPKPLGTYGHPLLKDQYHLYKSRQTTPFLIWLTLAGFWVIPMTFIASRVHKIPFRILLTYEYVGVLAKGLVYHGPTRELTDDETRAFLEGLFHETELYLGTDAELTEEETQEYQKVTEAFNNIEDEEEIPYPGIYIEV